MSLTKRKRNVAAGSNQRFGHCLPVLDQPDNFDSDQHKACPKSFVAHNTTANWSKGDTIYCQCACHGEVPEAWPGADASATQQLQEVPGDENTDEMEVPVTEQPEAPSETPAAAEPPLPALEGSADLPQMQTEAVQPVSYEGENETKRIKYKEGAVARVEFPDVNRKKEPVTGVKWVAYDLGGTRLGDHASLKLAKSEIGAQ